MFISFEGADGAGKSTQAAYLIERLKAAGRPALYVREPGGTPVGEELRRILKSGGNISPLTELLMFEAARAELVEKIIRPALERGEVVVADRFADSSVAYQAYGRGLPVQEVHALNRAATGGLAPDLTFLLDLPYEAAVIRSSGRDRAGPASAGALGQARRRFEDAPDDFHRRVVEGYRAIARAEPTRWAVIDATRPEGEVAEEVWAHVRRRLALVR